jgi:hypothetical protein
MREKRRIFLEECLVLFLRGQLCAGMLVGDCGMIDICCECNKKSSGAILTGVNHSGLVFGKRKPPNNRVRGGGRVLT